MEIQISAQKLRWACGFGGFALIGALAVLALESLHNVLITILALSAPLVLVLCGKALSDGLTKIRSALGFMSWWHGAWLLLFVSGLVFRMIGIAKESHMAMQQEDLDSWVYFRVALVSLTALILLTRLALRETDWMSLMRRGLIGMLTAYSLTCVASTLWSVYPQWTLYKSLEYMVDIAMLAAIVATIRSAEGYRKLFDWTWILYGLLLTSVWLGAVIWPDAALNRGIGVLGVELEGVLPAVSTNSVGEFAAVLAVVAFARLLTRTADAGSHRTRYVILFVASSITLIFSQGRSAIGGFVLGTILVLLFTKRTKLSLTLAGGAALLFSNAGANGLVRAFLERGETEQEIQSLSGRVEYWQLAWQKFLEHPFIGYGAYAAGRSIVISRLREDPGSMHSEYAEILVGTGLCGIVAAAIVLFATWWWLIRFLWNSSCDPLEKSLAVEAIGVLAVLTVRSFFSPNLFVHAPLTFFAVLGYAEYLRRRMTFRVPRRTMVVWSNSQGDHQNA